MTRVNNMTKSKSYEELEYVKSKAYSKLIFRLLKLYTRG